VEVLDAKGQRNWSCKYVCNTVSVFASPKCPSTVPLFPSVCGCVCFAQILALWLGFSIFFFSPVFSAYSGLFIGGEKITNNAGNYTTQVPQEMVIVT
jgi:hypothetical protein